MNTIKVLDHGFVALRNISGPTRRLNQEFDARDIDPANAARMSFDQTDSGRTEEQDLRLADYLMRNHHSSPFEMIEIWLEMKLPIFVARQFVRHRTVSLNEVSGRYVTLPAEWYIPDVVGGKAKDKKQGQSDNLPELVQDGFKDTLNGHCQEAYRRYEKAINFGVAPEHARMLLTLNFYTHWLWKQDLHNMMHFLKLRDHSHAQIEAQMYAKAIDKLLRRVLPHTMSLYDKYRKEV
jgi:thymidylate synthase (FAD)